MTDASVAERGETPAKLRAGAALRPVTLHRYRAGTSSFDREGCPDDRALVGLAGSSSARRFRAWRGGSGRRYVFSVFPMGAGVAALDGVPLDQEGAVIAAVRAMDGALHPLWIDLAGGPEHAWRTMEPYRVLAGRRDCELHVHLLADGRTARRSVVDDLRVA